jgi:AcrR family transcriptional regulator
LPEGTPQPSALFRRLTPGPGMPAVEVAAHQRARMLAAMIELCSERGYDRVSVAALTRAAGVSKASFYEQFSGKEACFLATYDLILREAARGLLVGERSEAQARDRLVAALRALGAKVVEEPRAAELVLLEGPAAGPTVLAHSEARLGLFEAFVAERLGASADGREPSEGLAGGIVAGVLYWLRRLFLAGAPDRFAELAGPLVDWGLSLEEQVAREVVERDDLTWGAQGRGGPKAIGPAGLPPDPRERERILAAALSVAIEEGVATLGRQAICARARVSGRCFASWFQSVDECLLVAAAWRLESLLEAAAEATAGEEPRAARVCAMLDCLVAALCADPGLTRLLFDELFALGREGLAWRQAAIALIADRLGASAPAAVQLGPVALEASVAALVANIGRRVHRGEVELLRRDADLLALFLLAPESGAPKALAEIAAYRGRAAGTEGAMDLAAA